ncbi:MAG TPA: alpha/beta hydrolase [Streptosporangiaceae bacterium]|nr:alpha/beta hydrolase [Streptosporangiaceae bacterium]
MDGPVVLVGHSAGCRIITQAGLHPSVRHLVYIAGLMPRGPDDPLTSSRRPPQPSVQLPDGSWTIPAQDAKSRFFTELDDATASWAAAQLSPQAPPFPDPTDNLTVFAWRERPSTYVMCAKDAAIDPGLQREMARRAGTSLVLESGHSPFLSHPAVIADLLESLAAG